MMVEAHEKARGDSVLLWCLVEEGFYRNPCAWCGQWGTKWNIMVHPRSQQMPLFRQPSSAQSGSQGLIANGSVCKGESWGARGSP